MDHSVYGYLERQTTEELCCIIHYCLTRDSLSIQEPIIRSAMEIIRSRYNALPDDLDKQLIQYAYLLDVWIQTEQEINGKRDR